MIEEKGLDNAIDLGIIFEPRFDIRSAPYKRFQRFEELSDRGNLATHRHS